MEPIEIRPDPITREWLEIVGESPELAAQFILEMTPTIWVSLLSDAAERLQLNESEAKAILDACNGLLLSPPLAGQHLVLEVADSFRLNRLDEKWGVDATLIDRLHVLSRGERWALEIWVGAFWVGGDRERYPGGRYNDPDFEREHLARVVRAKPRERFGDTGQPLRSGVDEPSNIQIAIRCTEVERTTWKQRAEESGLTLSEYVRRRVGG